MKNLLVTSIVLLLNITVFAQYPEVTIMDIQYQHPDSLLLYGDRPSPYEGQTVTIKSGIVTVAPYKDANPDSVLVLHAGAPALYLQDSSATDWAGILVRFVNPTSAFNLLDTGKIIRATGVVSEYYKTTQFNLISFEGSDVLGETQRPQPVFLTLDSLSDLGTGEGKLLAEKWEGVRIHIDTVTATTGGVGTGSYTVFDENNTEAIIGNESDYFRDNSTVPLPGTLVNVTGHIQNRDNVPGINFANIIMPEYPGDVESLIFPPAISDVTRNIVEVGYGDPVTVSANVIDADGTVEDVKLIYRKNFGVHNEVPMVNSTGDTWEAVIPAQNDSSLIDYFIRAVDNENNVSLTPSDTSTNRYFYLVLNRNLTIQDVQYSPFGSGYSGYHGFEVSVRGIVTADTSDLKGTETGTILGPQVYIQNGTGTWSGIKIFGTEALLLERGDDVTVTGTVGEDFNCTQISGLDNPANVQINSTGNTLPAPANLLTSEIADLNNGEPDAEKWEGVLIKYDNVAITDANADGEPTPHVGSPGNNNYGDILIADASNIYTRVGLQFGSHSYHNFWFDSLATYPVRVSQGDTFESLVGILWYGFSNYKLLPRKNDDFVGYVADVEDITELPAKYQLSQNFPNPFNPTTTIQYTIPNESIVTLKIYNILGQEVKTLINHEILSLGRHEVSFNANSLPSGIYFYRIQAGNFVDVKKMTLLK